MHSTDEIAHKLSQVNLDVLIKELNDIFDVRSTLSLADSEYFNKFEQRLTNAGWGYQEFKYALISNTNYRNTRLELAMRWREVFNSIRNNAP